MPLVKATVAVGFTAALALLADVTDVVTNVGTVVNEDWGNSIRRARIDDQLDRDAGSCMSERRPLSITRFEEAKLEAALYRCSGGTGVLHLGHDDGRRDTTVFYSPVLEERRTAGVSIVRRAHAGETVTVAQVSPADVEMILCQKRLDDDLVLLKIRTKAGICVDQVIDSATGVVVRETPNVPCAC